MRVHPMSSDVTYVWGHFVDQLWAGLWAGTNRKGKKDMTKLTVKEIKAASKGARLHDGHGLYLTLTAADRGKWSYRYRINGLSREMGLGPYPKVSLSDARALHIKYQAHKLQGRDPCAYRIEKEKIAIQRARLKFSDIAERLIESKKAGWQNEKHIKQWSQSLQTYASPILDAKPLNTITSRDILKILQPIWATKHETARRVQQRIKKVFGFAKTMGWYDHYNPAVWDDNLEHLLAPSRQVKRVFHHPSLDWSELPGFFKKLQTVETIASKALQFLILTACRTHEIRHCERDQINWTDKVWIIPAELMKARRTHRVPLCQSTVTLLESTLMGHNADYVFPRPGGMHPLSNMAMLTLLKREFPRKSITVHGFRSTFREWAASNCGYDHDTIEFSLAHKLPDRTKEAYLRSDLLDKRRMLMKDWEKFVLTN